MLSYLIRHWRGELPLSVAWWVNGVALTALSIAVDRFGGALVAVPEIGSRWEFTLLLAAGIFLLLLVPAWQVIGIFRAADRHCESAGTILAARLTQSLATLLTLGLATRFVVFAGESVPGIRLAYGPGSSYSVTVTHAGRLLEVRGGFGFGLARDVERVLAAHPGVRRVRLESGGGALGEARRLRALIATRDLHTDSRDLCASACVSAYIGGSYRLLSRAARIGLHLPRNPGFGPRGPVSDAYAEEIAYFAERGVPLWFRQRWVQAGRQFWYPPPVQLREAGVVDVFYGRPRPGEEVYYR